MDAPPYLIGLLVSLGLGLLVGLQRERSKPRLGGIRTFALVTLFGSLCAILIPSTGGWIVAAGLAAVAAATAIGNLFSLRSGDGNPGITSEIAMLAMFGIGALAIKGPLELAVVLGGSVAILLHAKPILHAFVSRLGDDDVRAIMQFALISLIILPILPNRTMGPLNVLNPHNIWLMVVLVVGMSLGGYVAYRVFGESLGPPLAGLLGGLISSTATTVSFSRRAKANSGQIPASIAVIMIAGTVVYARIGIEISVTSPQLLLVAAGPLLTIAVTSILLALHAWRLAKRSPCGGDGHQNPSELKSALVFGGIYAAVLLTVAAANKYLGSAGLYAVAAISGMTDMDAITLSSARMVTENQLDTDTAWRAIVLAAMSNNVFKLTMAGVIGGAHLLRPLMFLVVIKLAVAAGVLLFWPA